MVRISLGIDDLAGFSVRMYDHSAAHGAKRADRCRCTGGLDVQLGFAGSGQLQVESKPSGNACNGCNTGNL